VDTPHNAAKIPLVNSKALKRFIGVIGSIEKKQVNTAYCYQNKEKEAYRPKIVEGIVSWSKYPVCQTLDGVYDSSLDGKVFEIHK
jgi:hypothetical protein